MTTPTVQAVYLLQRVFQWAMGEAVTAGTPAPAAPSGLTAAAVAGRVMLNWQDNSQNESGFRIERRVGAAGTYATLVSLPADTTGYLDSGVSVGVTYYYRVFAFNPAGSNVSNETSVEVTATLGASCWELYR